MPVPWIRDEFGCGDVLARDQRSAQWCPTKGVSAFADWHSYKRLRAACEVTEQDSINQWLRQLQLRNDFGCPATFSGNSQRDLRKTDRTFVAVRIQW